jgi:hypothetical protein
MHTTCKTKFWTYGPVIAAWCASWVEVASKKDSQEKGAKPSL